MFSQLLSLNQLTVKSFISAKRRRHYLPDILVFRCVVFTTKRRSLFSENAERKSLTNCSIHFCPCFHLVVNGLNEIKQMKQKLLQRHLTVVEVEVSTHVSIHVRLLRDIMSKNCFLLAPLIQLQSADSNNQPMPRFKKRLRHLTVVEVEVFTIVLCAQTWKMLNTRN